MTTSADAWDAIEVLKIHNVWTCAGFAPSKGRRCQNPIAAHNRATGLQILDTLGDLDLTSRRVKQNLETLAPTILCRRNHQGQASSMVSQWLAMVEKLHEERERLVSLQMQREAAALRSQARISRRRLASTQTIEVSTRTTRISSTTEARPATPVLRNSQLPTPPTTPRRRTSNTNQATDEPQSSRAEPSQSTTHHLPPPAAPPSPSLTEPIATSPPASPLPSHTHTVSVEDCAICFEPMPSHTAIASECGHSFHAPCINRHLGYQDSLSPPQPHTCPYCRTLWIRRKVEGDCSICCDSLLREDDVGESESHNRGNDAEASGAEESEALVWCESRCGKNYHADCIQKWLVAAEELGSTRRCPDCRAHWVNS